MSSLLVLFAGLGTAYLVARRTGRFTRADWLIGLVAGLAGLGLAEFLGNAGPQQQLGLPLFFACALAFGLEALPYHTSSR